MGNADFVIGKMVHILPELIHFCPLGRAVRAAQRQQHKSHPESEVITQLSSALHISFMTNADYTPCNNIIYASNTIIHIFLIWKWDAKGHTLTITESIKAYFSLGIPQSISCKEISAIQTILFVNGDKMFLLLAKKGPKNMQISRQRQLRHL